MWIKPYGHRFTFSLLIILLTGLGSAESPQKSGPSDESRASTGTEESPARPKSLEMPGIENLFQLAPGLYSGAQPKGQAGFESLKRLGVKTIVSVDGARPDLERARSHGLRYVHLPVGYGGIEREQAIRLTKVARDLPGPLFVHCHHGQHRGPTAAALCGLATAGWSRDLARAWLIQAGTDPKYKGLYDTLDRFTPPSPQDLKRIGRDELPEQSDVPDLVDTMVQIDKHWDHLIAAQKSGFRPLPSRPDLDPAHAATMLAELFREAVRGNESAPHGREFGRQMAAADRDAAALETAILKLEAGAAPATANAAFTRLRQRCTACHSQFRDVPDKP